MIRLNVDLTNPGQFFGCCGLFELASRMWPGVTAHFEGNSFVVSAGELETLVRTAAAAPLTNLDANDASASPILVGQPFELRLDWWKAGAGEPALKPWAGTMLALRIAKALQGALPDTLGRGFFDHGCVVRGEDGTKVEPFYFDARRGANALPLDIGYSTDALALETLAFPATEFFTLVGLQRFRPVPKRPRVFVYRAWSTDLPIRLAALATADALPDGGPLFRFENAFRTDQRKHKAFSPAVPINGVADE
jgi:CRISPR-associated protein Csb3